MQTPDDDPMAKWRDLVGGFILAFGEIELWSSTPSPSQLTPASFYADFSAVAHDRGLLNPSRTAWFDASLCLPTPRGLPSSTSVASKNRSIDPSFASHITANYRV
jgi:hypothetical protein